MLVYIDQSIAKDVKVIKELKKVFYDLAEVCNEMGTFIEELETLKCSSDVVRSDLFERHSKEGCGKGHPPVNNEKDVKVIKELKKVFYDLAEVCNEMGTFIEELETLKCSSDVVRSDLFERHSKEGCGKGHPPVNNE
nr:hypothetical protein [Tanacetum cinerariifolium]